MHRVKGYYKQILAEYTNFIDQSEAQQILKSAKKDNMDVLNSIEGIQFLKVSGNLPEESKNIIDRINTLNFDENKFILYMDAIMDDLKFLEGTSKKLKME